MSSPTAPSSPERPPAASTLAALFATAAADRPRTTFVRTAQDDLSFADVDAWSAAVAGGLRERGVGPGDRVVVVAANRPETVVVWIACMRLGACFAPINPGLPPAPMATLLAALHPAAMLADGDAAPALSALTDALGRVGVVQFDGREWDAFGRDAGDASWYAGHAGDWAAVMCTSGTTGPSKAVALSHRWFTKICESTADAWGFSPLDRFYCPLPLYHMDALALTIAPAIYHRTTAAIGARFSVTRFWDEVRAFDATVFDFLGSTLTLLWKQPPRPNDADNTARLGWGVPLPSFRRQFEERFRCTLIDCYGSTDVGIPVFGRLGEVKPEGSCGRVVPGYEVAILDESGERVELGTVGEICVRPTEPHVILEEYVGEPEATLETWRGLWHHTGDLGCLDGDGYLQFEGRTTDYIRRRGENISAHELEALVLAHGDVIDVAAIGVPSELTEEDVKLIVVVRPGSELTIDALTEWLDREVPRFMTVRYVELVDDLPRTETGKVSKARLREHWRTARTWDAESNRSCDAPGD